MSSKKTKPRKKSRTSSHKSPVKNLSSQMKQRIRLEMKLQDLRKEFNEYKQSAANSFIEQIWAFQGVVQFLLEREILVHEDIVKEESPVGVEGIAQRSLASMATLLKYKEKAKETWLKDASKDQIMEYDKYQATALKWSEALDLSWDEFYDYLKTGVGLKDIVETLDKKDAANTLRAREQEASTNGD